MRLNCKISDKGENQCYLEQVAIHHQMHLTLLDLYQALGDIQTQAAAFGIPGYIAPDKAFHQFFSSDIQFFSGDVLQRNDDLAVDMGQIQLDTGSRHTVFDDVAQ